MAEGEAEGESCCKRLKFDLSLFDDKSDGDFDDDSEPSIITVNQSAANQLDLLPNEVIHEICMMLSLRDKMSLRLVNRRLYMICSDPHLWRNVFIDHAYHNTNAPFIKSALQTCRPHVQSLSLRGELPFSKYQEMLLGSDNISSLNLYGFQISVFALKKIYSDLHHLQFLSLTFAYELPFSLDKYFKIFAKLKKVVLVYNYMYSEPVKLFEKWLLNNCLPQTFIVISVYNETYWSRNIHHFPNINHSAYFAAYRKYRRPLNFDFYDIPQYSVEIGPNSSESVAMTVNGELLVTMRDLITPMNNDVSQRYAVFKDEAVTPGLSVYNSQYGVNITVLGFSCVTVSLESFRIIVKDTPNVLEVSLKGSIISDCLNAYMVPLSVHCLKLRGLDVSCFSSSSRVSVNFDVEHFWSLLSKMKYLEYLLVKCCSLSPLNSNSQAGKHPLRVLTDRELAVKERVIGHIKRMTRLKGLHVVDATETEELDYFISQHLLSMISNLESLLYLGVNIGFAACIASLKSYNIEGLESILQKCQKLSVLIINCTPIKVIELPVDPALYGNLTHLWLHCSFTPMDLVFGDALSINSKKKLKHLLLRRQNVSTEKDVLDRMIKEDNFITLYEFARGTFNRYDRNRSKNWSKQSGLDRHVAEFPTLY
uniref:F-box domain-containing protein n=1 Tax=Amphimedon queenslandica TaxID=400682 RepID=A0A1X7V8V9_AMPQE